MIPKIPVHFIYLSPNQEGIPDKEFAAVCVSVPRIGETVVPQAGSQKVVVHNVYNKFVMNEEIGPPLFLCAAQV